MLPLLQDLDVLRDYDWGSATYGYLLYGLDDAYRGSSWICGVPLAVDVSYSRCFVVYFFFCFECTVPDVLYFCKFRPLSFTL